VRHLPIGRGTGVEAVVGHDARMQPQVDGHGRDIAARGGPLNERAVVALRVGAGHPTQRLRQARELVHRRQRGKGHVAHAARVAQPVGQGLARGHRAVRGNLVDDIVDAGDDERDVDVGRGVEFVAQQRVRLRRGQPRARQQLPLNTAARQPGQPLRQRRGQRLPLLGNAHAGGRGVAGNQQPDLQCRVVGTGAAGAFAVGFGQPRQPGAREQRLRHQQGAQHQLCGK